jgi:hypothetical protein
MILKYLNYILIIILFASCYDNMNESKIVHIEANAKSGKLIYEIESEKNVYKLILNPNGILLIETNDYITDTCSFSFNYNKTELSKSFFYIHGTIKDNIIDSNLVFLALSEFSRYNVLITINKKSGEFVYSGDSEMPTTYFPHFIVDTNSNEIICVNDFKMTSINQDSTIVNYYKYENKGLIDFEFSKLFQIPLINIDSSLYFEKYNQEFLKELIR